MKKTGKRQNGIDLLRILAAVLICFSSPRLYGQDAPIRQLITETGRSISACS